MGIYQAGDVAIKNYTGKKETPNSVRNRKNVPDTSNSSYGTVTNQVRRLDIILTAAGTSVISTNKSNNTPFIECIISITPLK